MVRTRSKAYETADGASSPNRDAPSASSPPPLLTPRAIRQMNRERQARLAAIRQMNLDAGLDDSKREKEGIEKATGDNNTAGTSSSASAGAAAPSTDTTDAVAEAGGTIVSGLKIEHRVEPGDSEDPAPGSQGSTLSVSPPSSPVNTLPSPGFTTLGNVESTTPSAPLTTSPAPVPQDVMEVEENSPGPDPMKLMGSPQLVQVASIDDELDRHQVLQELREPQPAEPRFAEDAPAQLERQSAKGTDDASTGSSVEAQFTVEISKAPKVGSATATNPTVRATPNDVIDLIGLLMSRIEILTESRKAQRIGAASQAASGDVGQTHDSELNTGDVLSNTQPKIKLEPQLIVVEDEAASMQDVENVLCGDSLRSSYPSLGCAHVPLVTSGRRPRAREDDTRTVSEANSTSACANAMPFAGEPELTQARAHVPLVISGARSSKVCAGLTLIESEPQTAHARAHIPLVVREPRSSRIRAEGSLVESGSEFAKASSRVSTDVYEAREPRVPAHVPLVVSGPKLTAIRAGSLPAVVESKPVAAALHIPLVVSRSRVSTSRAPIPLVDSEPESGLPHPSQCATKNTLKPTSTRETHPTGASGPEPTAVCGPSSAAVNNPKPISVEQQNISDATEPKPPPERAANSATGNERKPISKQAHSQQSSESLRALKKKLEELNRRPSLSGTRVMTIHQDEKQTRKAQETRLESCGATDEKRKLETKRGPAVVVSQEGEQTNADPNPEVVPTEVVKRKKWRFDSLRQHDDDTQQRRLEKKGPEQVRKVQRTTERLEVGNANKHSAEQSTGPPHEQGGSCHIPPKQQGSLKRKLDAHQGAEGGVAKINAQNQSLQTSSEVRRVQSEESQQSPRKKRRTRKRSTKRQQEVERAVAQGSKPKRPPTSTHRQLQVARAAQRNDTHYKQVRSSESCPKQQGTLDRRLEAHQVAEGRVTKKHGHNPRLLKSSNVQRMQKRGRQLQRQVADDLEPCRPPPPPARPQPPIVCVGAAPSRKVFKTTATARSRESAFLQAEMCKSSGGRPRVATTSKLRRRLGL